MISNLCRNSEDKDKVWTFGSGPRHCIGHLLSKTILKVRPLPTRIMAKGALIAPES